MEGVVSRLVGSGSKSFRSKADLPGFELADLGLDGLAATCLNSLQDGIQPNGYDGNFGFVWNCKILVNIALQPVGNYDVRQDCMILVKESQEKQQQAWFSMSTFLATS